MDQTESYQKFCEMKHYSPEYGYWEKMTDAELYGGKTVKKQFEKCFKEAGTNKYKLSELEGVLWRKYDYFCKNNDDIYADLYYELYEKLDTFACENLDESEIIYYMRMAI